MIPILNKEVTVSGNLEGKRIAMSLDESALIHLGKVLTDLYSDPEATTVREVVANAWDSHTEAGQTRPVDVTLPSIFNQYFVVQDYGVGLSVDDMENIYSKFGASTKRKTNKLIGALGLGSKSPLAYTSQFTVTAVKNGVKTQATVARTELGVSEIQIIDTRSTSDVDGVKITIPVKDMNSFNEKAKLFFSFSDPTKTLVNGTVPEVPERMEIAPGLSMTRNESTDYIVMGGVYYKIDAYQQRISCFHNVGAVAEAPIGSLEFTPSREALLYTPKTIQTIKNLADKFRTSYTASVREQIEACNTYSDALDISMEWRTILSSSISNSLSYKGSLVPVDMEWANSVDRPHLWNRNATRNSTSIMWRYGLREAKNTLFVSNVIGGSPAPALKAKVRHWLTTQAFEPSYVVFMPTDFWGEWFSGFNKVDYSVIKAVKVPKSAPRVSYGPIKEKPQSYDVITPSGAILEDDTFTSTTSLAYVMVDEFKRQNGHTSYSQLKSLAGALEDIKLVLMPRNRLAKFLRTFPQAKPYSVHAEKFAKQAEEAILTDEDRRYIGVSKSQKAELRYLQGKSILDPEIQEFIEFCLQKNYDTSRIDRYNDLEHILRGTKRVIPATRFFDDIPDKIVQKYPLLSGGYGGKLYASHDTVDDAVFFMNAKFTQTINDSQKAKAA